MQKKTPPGRWTEEVSRFTFFENTISNSRKVLRAKFLESDVLFCFISICKFCSFKFLFVTGLVLVWTLGLDLSFCYKRKKWFLLTMAAAQAAENHGDAWGLTWYFLWGLYTSIPTWTQNSLKEAEAASLNISSHGPSLKWSQRMLQSAQE